MLLKLRKYHDAGVREYWIVDPEKEAVLVYVFEENDLFPDRYTFSDTIPDRISEGECEVDFRKIREKLRADMFMMIIIEKIRCNGLRAADGKGHLRSGKCMIRHGQRY